GEDGGGRSRGRGGGFHYTDYANLSGCPERIELFDQKGFRYLELHNWYEDELNPDDVRVITLNYPFPENGGMSCSDPMFERIWRLCADGVRWGTQDTFFGCPTREKGGFLGDAFITAASHLLITGDARILKKLLLDFAVSLRQDPGMTDVAPAYITGGLIDYTLLYPMLIERYYTHTADLAFVRSLLFTIESIHEWVMTNWNEDKLLKGTFSPIEGFEQTLIDWPRPYRERFDFAGARAEANAVLNANYYGFCQSSARLYDLCGETEAARDMRTRADEIASAMGRTMYDAERGLFTDHVHTRNCTLHGNAPALCFGVPFPGGCDRAADFVAKEGLNCGVYFAYFVIKGLFRAGKVDEAWQMIAGDAENSWQTMLKNGATTCWETWNLYNPVGNGSHCHPWSSSPVIFWAEEICGIRPTSPGWENYEISPKIPAALDQGSVRVPTPKGIIEMSFERKNGEISVSSKLFAKS
ncbi:MAG: hypothetical protein MJ175_11895, partial [Clostridia bacterium]|nr:hypothetical protein [Clostridia bacterium]